MLKRNKEKCKREGYQMRRAMPLLIIAANRRQQGRKKQAP